LLCKHEVEKNIVHYFCNHPAKLIYCSTENSYKVSNVEILCYEGQQNENHEV